MLLIRRPGRRARGRPARPGRWSTRGPAGSGSAGAAGPTRPSCSTCRSAPGRGQPGGPLYLVCAHGRHDPCCAIRGRPVAEALAAARPGAVWECSHVGGDRFAANLVALPHGLFYAHVTAGPRRGVAAAYERGEVRPDLLRGRSAFAPPAQAAQHYARLELGETGVDALRPLGMATARPSAPGGSGWPARRARCWSPSGPGWPRRCG